MSWPLPAVVIFQPPDGFEVPPLTMAPPVGTQPPAGSQPPVAVQPPAGAQPPSVVAQVVTVGPLPVTTQNPVGLLQPVLVTGQAPGGNVTIQVDHGPPIHAELTAARDPSPGVFGFSATVTIPDSPGPHVITATAVDDPSLNPTANVQVWVGPAFAIAPPAVLVEVYYPQKILNLPANLVGEIQQHLTSLQALAGKYGLTVAGPAFTLATPPNSPPVLRIGLWITDSAFATVPASPPDLPLPSLSEAQAASCFGVTPLVLSGELPDATAAVSLPTTTLQTVVDAGSPTIVAAGARHGITVNTVTASTSPPNTVTVTADCTLTAGDTGTISVTETLGTTMVSWESGDPAMPTPLHVPAVTKTTPGSSDGVGEVVELFGPPAWVISVYDSLVSMVAAGDAADKVSGILGPLLAAFPYAYPFPNSFITSVVSTDTTPPDFPVLSLDWTSFGATDTGVVGGVTWSLGNRAQDDVVLTIEGQTYITADPVQFGYNPQLVFTWALQNLNPGSFSWTLTGDAQAQGDLVASPFTQAGSLTVPINLASLPDVTRGTYQFTLSVSASETCASDPAKVLTAAWSSLINLRLVPSQ